MALHPLFIGYASSHHSLMASATLLTLTNSGLAWPCGGGLAWHTNEGGWGGVVACHHSSSGMHHVHHASFPCDMTDFHIQWPSMAASAALHGTPMTAVACLAHQ